MPARACVLSVNPVRLSLCRHGYGFLLPWWEKPVLSVVEGVRIRGKLASNSSCLRHPLPSPLPQGERGPGVRRARKRLKLGLVEILSPLRGGRKQFCRGDSCLTPTATTILLRLIRFGPPAGGKGKTGKARAEEEKRGWFRSSCDFALDIAHAVFAEIDNIRRE
jgi:hypothetical protein